MLVNIELFSWCRPHSRTTRTAAATGSVTLPVPSAETGEMLKATIMRTTYRGSRRNLSRRSTVSRDLHHRKRIPMADINGLASRLDLQAEALAGQDVVRAEAFGRHVP